MLSRKVGDNPFTIDKILKIIKKSAEYAAFQLSWTGLTRNLNIEQPDVINNQLRRDNILGLLTFEDLLVRLLQRWLAELGRNATIDALCIAFENCGYRNISEALQSGFGIVVEKNKSPISHTKPEDEVDKKPSASVAPQVRTRTQQPAQHESTADEGASEGKKI